MSRAPDGRSLVGPTVRLDAARYEDAEDLFRALDHDEVWAMGYSASSPRRRSAADWQAAMRSAHRSLRTMYVVRLVADGRIVGTTSIGDIDLDNEGAHVGWTAYAPDVWGTSVNPGCKLLLLAHAFEDCGLGRVMIRTDLINTRSQAAIAKLGARREGVLRRHIKRADGTWRDSVVYSVIIDDWPHVKAGLQARLSVGVSAG